MTEFPWDLPVEKASKRKLLNLLRDFESKGQVREAGTCCSRLAHLLKQIGPFDESALYGQKAVELLRQTDDKKELIRALRAACVPFNSLVDHEAYLREALALSIQVGDRAEEAWTIYRLTRAFTPTLNQQSALEKLPPEESIAKYSEWKEKARDGHTVEEALAIFEEIGDERGIATCLVSLGVERKPSERALFERAIELFAHQGDMESVRRTTLMADTFAPLPKPWDLPHKAASLPILMALTQEYRNLKDRTAIGLCLSRSAKLAIDFGSIEDANRMAREAVKTLRKNKEATEYCVALHLVARTTDDRKKRQAYFEKVATMSEEFGDMKLTAWAIYHLSTENPNSDRRIEDALEIFEDMKYEQGIVACRKWMSENLKN